MTERKSISKSTRFEVFKRDKFTCQYCGKSAPEVVLHIDHIQPISKGGDNSIANLITACAACNGGKSNRELSDDTVIAKQKLQLDELQERRDQLEMMFEWQKGLMNIETDIVTEASSIWSNLVKPFSLTESGLNNLKRLLRVYGFPEVIESMKRSVEQYLEYDSETQTPKDDSVKRLLRVYGFPEVIESMKRSVEQYLEYDSETQTPKDDSVEKAWAYVEKIARSRKQIADRPSLADAYKIIGLLNFKIDIHYPGKEARRIAYCLENGADLEVIQQIARIANSWWFWDTSMREVENGLDSD